jgi:glycosyltransferase involved in cell wall biosynthesis
VITEDPLVSVVIPAYNAASTLDETLRSVRSQTHKALEIIIVDDGSTDATQAVAQQHAATDARVQIVHQDNAGVAAARNTGWHRARSDLIAFVDADDLWAPQKIERQVEALHAGDERVGFVYCGTELIDGAGVVIEEWLPQFDGDVLKQILSGHFIGNGSAALIRREALVDVGGFDASLRAADAEGCEDYLLACRIAEKYHFAFVPEHLVGYRHLPTNMSSNRPRMLRSHMLVADMMLARHPQYASEVRLGLRSYASWMVREALHKRTLAQLPALMLLILRCPASVLTRVLLSDLPRMLIESVDWRVGRAARRRGRASHEIRRMASKLSHRRRRD